MKQKKNQRWEGSCPDREEGRPGVSITGKREIKTTNCRGERPKGILEGRGFPTPFALKKKDLERTRGRREKGVQNCSEGMQESGEVGKETGRLSHKS